MRMQELREWTATSRRRWGRGGEEQAAPVSQEELDRRVHEVLSGFELVGPFSAGYPVNQKFDYSALYPLLAVRREQRRRPVRLLALPGQHDENRARGRARRRRGGAAAGRAGMGVRHHGRHRGHMYGIYVGREMLRQPVAYFSQDTHYSVLRSSTSSTSATS